MTRFSSILIGDESLLIGCAEHLLDQGHGIRAVVSGNRDILTWARERDLPVAQDIASLPRQFAAGSFDWLLSIANLSIIPADVLNLPAKGSVNFHDGPLPGYAGLNTPAWAIINGESQHGVTWHLIEGGVDEGDILEQRLIDISDDETAFSLNSKCYAAAMESFPAVVGQLAANQLARQAQDLGQRSYFARYDRPAGAGRLDFSQPAKQLGAFVRALDFGPHRNALLSPRIEINGQLLVIGKAEADETTNAAVPGTVQNVTANGLRIATGAGSLALRDISDLSGGTTNIAGLLNPGDRLATPDAKTVDAQSSASRRAARAEMHWASVLRQFQPVELSLATSATDAPDWQSRAIALPDDLGVAKLAAAVLAWARHSSGDQQAGVACVTNAICAANAAVPGILSNWVPLQTSQPTGAEVLLSDVVKDITRLTDNAATLGAFASDLPLRDPDIGALRIPDIALSIDAAAPLPGSVVTLSLAGPTDHLVLHHDASRLTQDAVQLLANRLLATLDAVACADAPLAPFAQMATLPAAEKHDLVVNWNQTNTNYDPTQTIHRAFEEQAARTPDAIALVFETTELSFDAMNASANGLARRLVDLGVKPGSHVGLHVARGPDLLIGALAILKAGGAYVPLDPAYPADRLAHYVTDSQASVIVTQSGLIGALPDIAAAIVNIDEHRDTTFATNVDGGAAGDDLAYIIYTSGSTGTPKGVMVEHRNVANFFTGMDKVVEHDEAGVWLAVTSLAFDISVLELFYTLARGKKLVLVSDDIRTNVSNGPITGSGRQIDFSLYYWSNDCEAGPDKYKLLLEGAKFADANGFDALWTPERHFHAFGGPYPNPAVTGAAVAAVTKNLSVRAGSCVAPLHHPARIAEEWSVIDNLTNGRTGLAIASGWQPEDFILRPQNTPPDNKAAMFETIDQLRRLWRGEAVEFPGKSGQMVPVVTQPRPVSRELALWVTTAGNPDTWREAGAIGANILTHLLGQSVAEVGEKITLYHEALRAAGHNPADHTVTVMLHTLVGEDRDAVEKIVRKPLREYLRSAAGLIKQYAWAFPAFKKPKGVANPFQMDLSKLDDTEMEAILDFAFERYFNDAGLFGTVEDAVARVEELKQIGVGEVACLIDYGVPTQDVLDSLIPLAEVRKQSNRAVDLQDDDFSVAAQTIRHSVTHMQATPSMARMLAMNDEACLALGQLRHLYLGGEALPGALVDELRGSTRAQITNMYGPTETTIWSATQPVDGAHTAQGIVPIGQPIANTTFYVLDALGKLAPIGVAGELFIGGSGVTRGYWQRDDLTAERFVPDRFGGQSDERLYRTGDLVRRRADGTLDYLGRTDHQVKIRGQRIELGEIETTLAGHPAVRDAVVIAKTADNGEVHLAAYLTTSDTLNLGALRRQLQDRLPAVMVPRHLTVLDHFPLTPNKKIDRNALPDPQRTPVPVANNEANPQKTCAEAAIAAIWSRILGVNGIRSSDSFFDLGGHSLLAVQAHREILRELAVPKLAITDIFRFPKLSALAAHLDALNGTADGLVAAPVTTPAKRTDPGETMSKRRAMRANRDRKAG